jgi:hypothetical protein
LIEYSVLRFEHYVNSGIIKLQLIKPDGAIEKIEYDHEMSIGEALKELNKLAREGWEVVSHAEAAGWNNMFVGYWTLKRAMK